MATLAALAAEEASIAEALSSVRLPEGVSLRSFDFVADNTGEPAVRLTFGLSRKYPLTEELGRELSHAKAAAMLAVYATGTDRIVFTKLESVD